jgi:hypothetical protein
MKKEVGLGWVWSDVWYSWCLFARRLGRTQSHSEYDGEQKHSEATARTWTLTI